MRLHNPNSLLFNQYHSHMSKKTMVQKALGFMGRIKVRMSNFLYYKVLSNKKSLLMIGGDDYPEMRSSFIQKYSTNWKIASLSITESKTDLHIPLTYFSTEQYKNIESQVTKFTKLFDSIVVLPSKIQAISLQNQTIFQHFQSHSYNKAQQSLLAYKLASKMLTPNGIVILTGSEKAFFGDKEAGALSGILTGQASYVNTILGERDHTDVNSCSLLVLTDDVDLRDGEKSKQIVELIKTWSEGTQLPYPGSFAKILTKNLIHYPEFF